MNYFVTAIGTDSGKTIASAIICEALEADYWKPVQSGLPRDTDTVAGLISNQRTRCHPERYLLNTPISPHASAAIDGISIDLDSFALPATSNVIVAEGAGGCLVPLNDHHLIIDLIAFLQMEVVIVSNHYIGSINHTLLTVEALTKRKLPIKGLIFNGERNSDTERIILHRTGLRCLLHIEKEKYINKDVIRRYASEIDQHWND